MEESAARNSSKDNLNPALAWAWLILSILITCAIFERLSIEPISLYDSSCGLPTISECNIEAITKAKQEIQEKLPPKLEKLMATRETFPFKLVSSSYRLLIVDKDSMQKVEVSNPPQSFPTGKIDLLCTINSERVVLKNQKRIKLMEIAYTGSVQKGVDDTVAALDKFQGCTWLPREAKTEFKPSPGTVIVAPEGVVSWRMFMKPVLEFRIGYWAGASVFFAVFAVIGALLALVKQFLHVARRGVRYFCDDC